MGNARFRKNPMPVQDPGLRIGNFDEVALGYNDDTAIAEAKRCLGCKGQPCVAGCPVNVRIPEFINAVAEGDFSRAYAEIAQTNALPAICGRVCPQETQCEMNCVLGKKGEPVAIGRLERFVADWHLKNGNSTIDSISPNGHKVAVVGAGPASLTCAGDLAKLGYAVTILEAFHAPGGVLIYGIPEFRLPKAIVAREVADLSKRGVEIRTNTVVGKTITLDELMVQGHEAVFIGSGAGLPSFMRIPGESLLGVYSANEYLTRINLMKAYSPQADTPIARSSRVAVVGGGNVAMDAARCARRLGADVTIVYRRSETELPARAEEVHHAREEGIHFRLLTNPMAIHGDERKRVSAIECLEMELGEPDESGRRRPVAKKGSNFCIDVDTVIMAIGTSPNPLIAATTEGLETNKWGCIVADENGATTRKFVYAGGDAVTGAATVIEAMGAGKKAAAAIHLTLQATHL